MKQIKVFLIAMLILITATIYGKILNSNSNYTIQNQTSEERILGVWVMENNPSDKIEFLANGQLKWYQDDILLYTDNYSVSNICSNTISEDWHLYLNTVDKDGTEFCFTILNGVYEDDSNLISYYLKGKEKL